MNEYNKTNEAIKKAVGNDKFNSLVFRFPGGSVGGTYNDLKKEAEKQLEEKGIGSVDWNALTNDAAGANSSQIYSNVTSGISKRHESVVLMHDIKRSTIDVIEDIIVYGLNNGYTFDTLNVSSPTVHHHINN